MAPVRSIPETCAFGGVAASGGDIFIQVKPTKGISHRGSDALVRLGIGLLSGAQPVVFPSHTS